MKAEADLRLQIERYQQRVFALVLYLIGGNRDKAYNIVASSFTEAIHTTASLEKEVDFLNNVVRLAIEESRAVIAVPHFDETDFADLRPEKRNSLFSVRTALQELSFNEKAYLLLRYQLHFTYKNISFVLAISESKVRSQTTQARMHLRDKVKEALSRAG